MRNHMIIALGVAACLTLTGCVSSSKTKVTVAGTTTISKGQELTDLQRALDAGAISQSDYDSVRSKLLKRD